MKHVLLLVILTISGLSLFSQNESLSKIIFIPHPRTEDKTNQSVNAGIAKIDFSKYGVKMLGGDLTYSTSEDSATLAYCDSIFDLDNLNTLWSFGNHDVESGNRSLIKEFTGRDSYYTYTRNKITFMVLDCELDAESFSATYIKDDQLQMVKNVCDTISDSNFLVLLHSRYIWMINNDYFTDKLDSVAASSKSMDTTNFYSEIYPLLQEVKSRGIQIHVFGGDKSLINVTYSKEDSITFHAARMSNTYVDSVNNVIVIDYNEQNKTMTCNFVTLTDINNAEDEDTTIVVSSSVLSGDQALKIASAGSKTITIQVQSSTNIKTVIKLYTITGALCQTISCNSNETSEVSVNQPGIYIARATIGTSTLVKKFVIQ